MVNVLGDRDVRDSAGTSMLSAIACNLGVVVREDRAGAVEVIVVDESDLGVSQVANKRFQGALLDPG